MFVISTVCHGPTSVSGCSCFVLRLIRIPNKCFRPAVSWLHGKHHPAGAFHCCMNWWSSQSMLILKLQVKNIKTICGHPVGDTYPNSHIAPIPRRWTTEDTSGSGKCPESFASSRPERSKCRGLELQGTSCAGRNVPTVDHSVPFPIGPAKCRGRDPRF